MMKRLRTLTLTDAIYARVAALRQARDLYVPGGMSASIVEIPEIALAREVMAALKAQELESEGRGARLDSPRKMLAAGQVNIGIVRRRHRG